jgi:hypothetical protein
MWPKLDDNVCGRGGRNWMTGGMGEVLLDDGGMGEVILDDGGMGEVILDDGGDGLSTVKVILDDGDG